MAVDEMLSKNSQVESVYIESIRDVALRTYGAMPNPDSKPYFLDKTTRYYLILDFLFEVFPQSAFVFLDRNPLAIAASVMSYGKQGRSIFDSTDRQRDLFTAPVVIREAGKTIAPAKRLRSASVSYEDLVADPERTVAQICEQIGLPYEPGMLDYGGKVDLGKTNWVDGKSVYKHSSVVGNYKDAWPQSIETKSELRFFERYLDQLPDDCVNGPGYTRESLREKLGELGGHVKRDKLMLGRRAKICMRDFMDYTGTLGIAKRLLRHNK